MLDAHESRHSRLLAIRLVTHRPDYSSASEPSSPGYALPSGLRNGEDFRRVPTGFCSNCIICNEFCRDLVPAAKHGGSPVLYFPGPFYAGARDL